MANGLKFKINLNNEYDYLSYQVDAFIKLKSKNNKSTLYSFIKDIILENINDFSLKNLTIRFNTNSEILNIYDINIDSIDPNEKIKIADNINIVFNVEKLYSLNETLPLTLEINIFDNNKESIYNETIQYCLYPLNESNTFKQNKSLLVSFITPNDKVISEIIYKAQDEIKKLRPSNPQFIGYQNLDLDNVRLEMCALFNTLKKENIGYINPPSSFNNFQRVRLNKEVINTKLGTCLDLSLLYCAVLEAIGLYPLLILLENHAFVGCFLSEDHFIENEIKDVGKIYNYSCIGNMQIELVECTNFTLGQNVSFDEASINARKKLENYTDSFVALNVYPLHKEFIKPVPTLNDNESLDFNLYFNNKIKEELNSKYSLENGIIYQNKGNKKDKFTYWNKKLLDLSLKNKLINFSYGNNVGELIIDDSKNIFERLNDRNTIDIYPLDLKLKKYELINEIDRNKYSYLISKNIYPISIDDKTYIKLIKKANSLMEETGTNSLYLTLGLLSFTFRTSKKTLYAPIFLLPIKSKLRKNNNNAFEIEVDTDNLLLNVTVFEYIKLNTGINFEEIYDLNKNTLKHFSLTTVFNYIRAKTSNELSLLVDEKKSFISSFTFSNQILWNDINIRKDDLMKNDFISRLVEERPYLESDDKELEDKNEKLAIPLGADSSQIKAIKDSIHGKSFVLDGPPGTGKSQTIVNMIVNALYNKKTVLFVAQKMAALDVVKKRIDDIKLGDFCLEIHSNKATKRHVLEQLEKAISNGRVMPPIEIEEAKNKLDSKTLVLDELVNKLETNKYQDTTLIEAISRYMSLEEFEFNDSNKYDDALNLTKDNILKINETLDSLALIESTRKKYNDLIFYPYDLEEPKENDKLQKDLLNLKESLESFKREKDNLNNYLDNNFVFSRNNTNLIMQIIKLFKENELSFNGIYLNEFKENIDINYEVIKLGESLNNYLSNVLNYYNLDILNYDFTQINNDLNSEDLNFFSKKKVVKNSLKFLKTFSKSTKNLKFSFNDFKKLVDEIIKSQELIKSINLKNKNLLKVFPELKDDINYQYKNLKAKLDASYTYIDLFNKLYNKNNENYSSYFSKFKELYELIKSGELDILIDTCLEQYNEINKYEDVLVSNYSFNPNYLKFDSDINYIEEYINLLNLEINNIGEINSVLIFNKLFKTLKDNKFFINPLFSFRRKEIDLYTLKERYLLSYYKFIILSYFKDPYYKEFNGLLFSEAINKYNEYLDEYNTLLIKETAARITENYPLENVDYSKTSDIYRLLKVIKNNGKNASIRTILKEFEDIILNLTPIFFMSPISAAQFLSIDNKKFDIIIFDEASQIETSEALGAISRGNSLIVAGDPEQMPPTNFFKTNIDNSDDEGDFLTSNEDLESLLDDALTLNMRRNRLLWHYRSQSESLIKFSNNYFYNHSLYTFPSPIKDNRVKFKYLPLGMNEKGVNKVEAYEILKEVKRRFSDETLRHDSIGIITFNIKQQEFIQDLIDDLFEQYPEFNQINEENKDQIFVKNLENVQGDERDVILFSVGFSKNKNKKLNNFFGPLSITKGERRLNVAITRSRKEMIVFSSIKGNEIDVERTKNNGAKVLRDFLNYSEFGDSYIIGEYSKSTKVEEGLEKEIANELKKLGYEADINVGDSKFKISIAIKGHNNKYILGIILDNDSYLLTPTCRDRNYVQPHILDKLNWKILRVYTLDYFNNKKEVIGDIIKALNNPNLVEFSELDFKDVNFEKKLIDPYQNKVDYNEYIPTVKFNYDGVKENIYYTNVTTILKDIINIEGPISRNKLFDKFKKLFNISKGGSRLERIFDFQIENLNPNKQIETFDTIYFPYNFNELIYLHYRSSSLSQRKIEDIPLIEIRNAVNDILMYQNSISLEEAANIIGHLFNYKIINSVLIDKIIKHIKLSVVIYNTDYYIEDNLLQKRV